MGSDKPDRMSDVQAAFWQGLTDQRVANMWDSADFIAELRPEARDLLRNADPKTMKWLERASEDDIAQLDYAIKFIGASKLLGRAAWIVGATLFGIAIGVMTIWDRVKTLFVAK